MPRHDLNLVDSSARCREWRKKILDISQHVSALHIAPAFSSTEIVDAVYFSLMKGNNDVYEDIFILSKGHGCMIQYVILNALGYLTEDDLRNYCKMEGILGAHPDFGTPGVSASTGSLGHGLGIAVGQAYAEKLKKSSVSVYCLISDGELQEGSTWEALMMAANLNVTNLVVIVDNNDFSGLERMSVGHKAFYPIVEKVRAFGWNSDECDGHDSNEVVSRILERNPSKPYFLTCKTTKGKGVSFMENVPIWHYRSPSPGEYLAAISDLGY